MSRLFAGALLALTITTGPAFAGIVTVSAGTTTPTCTTTTHGAELWNPCAHLDATRVHVGR